MMTVDEREVLFTDSQFVAKKLMEKLRKHVDTADKMSWQEMMYASDIIKDLSEVEKNIAKTHHYSKDVAEGSL